MSFFLDLNSMFSLFTCLLTRVLYPAPRFVDSRVGRTLFFGGMMSGIVRCPVPSGLSLHQVIMELVSLMT